MSLRDSGVGWSMHLWRAEGVRHKIVQKRSTYKCMYGETYIVWVIGSKTPCEKEMLMEKL